MIDVFLRNAADRVRCCSSLKCGNNQQEFVVPRIDGTLLAGEQKLHKCLKSNALYALVYGR